MAGGKMPDAFRHDCAHSKFCNILNLYDCVAGCKAQRRIQVCKQKRTLSTLIPVALCLLVCVKRQPAVLHFTSPSSDARGMIGGVSTDTYRACKYQRTEVMLQFISDVWESAIP